MSNKNNASRPHDPYDKGQMYAPTVYAWETVDVEYQDVGANDEGYYYRWCGFCESRTEHDSCGCISCEINS